MSANGIRHFLDLSEIPKAELREMLDASCAMKEKPRPQTDLPLAGKALALIFEKESTRTRVSFEVAMQQLGGHAI